MELHQYVYGTLVRAFEQGLSSVETLIPVTDLASNQIVLAATCSGEGGVEKAPHVLSLTQNRVGAYLVRICSTYGLACPDPLMVMGDQRVIDLRDPVIDLRGKRNRSLELWSWPEGMSLLGEFFDGRRRTINMSRDSLDLFGVQIQGVFSRRLT